MITRLSERHLASLYDQTVAPVRLHTALYGEHGLTEKDGNEIESIIRHNPPDLALISLGLCAVVLADFLSRKNNEELPAIVTEMKYLGIESVETFGPPYLGEDIGLDDLDDLLALCPIQLCALGSLFEDTVEEYEFTRILSEIAYDQADKAEAMLAGEPLPQIEQTEGDRNAVSESSNVVSLDLFSAWRKEKETAE